MVASLFRTACYDKDVPRERKQDSKEVIIVDNMNKMDKMNNTQQADRLAGVRAFGRKYWKKGLAAFVAVAVLPSLDDKMSVIPYTTRVDAHFLHNNMDYAITATFDFICRMSPREKIRASIFSPTA